MNLQSRNWTKNVIGGPLVTKSKLTQCLAGLWLQRNINRGSILEIEESKNYLVFTRRSLKNFGSCNDYIEYKAQNHCWKYQPLFQNTNKRLSTTINVTKIKVELVRKRKQILQYYCISATATKIMITTLITTAITIKITISPTAILTIKRATSF